MLNFIFPQMTKMTNAAKMTRQQVIANGEKSANAILLQMKEAPQTALTTKSRKKSEGFGVRMDVTKCKKSCVNSTEKV